MVSKTNVVEFRRVNTAASDNSISFKVTNDVQTEKVTFILDNVFDLNDPFVKYLQAYRKEIIK